MDFPRDIFIEKIKDCEKDFQESVIKYVDVLNTKGLPVIFSYKHLAGILNIDEVELQQLLKQTDGFYACYLIKKKKGGFRRIVVPYENLKRVQRWILSEILDKVVVSHSCNGFIKGRSTLTNANPHLGKRFVRKFDFKDFFESITVDRVYGVFKSLGYSPAVSHDLATLCTLKLGEYKFENLDNKIKKHFVDLYTAPRAVLAQGAPTSPMLANLVCRELDFRFEKYALKHGISYTRYADDLTFSSDDPVKLPSASLVKKIVEEEGLRLNYKKTGTYGRDSRQVVTGILVDKDVPRLSQKFKRQIYRHLHFCKKFGVKQHFDEVMPNHSHVRQWLYGKMWYVHAIEPKEAKKMFAIADKLDWGLL